MSIVIKGVEMPKESWECPCHNGETGWCKVTGRSCCDIPKDCPLIEIQTGLGLIESYVPDMKELPSAQPEQKTGKWIIEIEEEHTEKYDARIPHWFCSCCRTEYDSYFASRINYCYNCGVKLEV